MVSDISMYLDKNYVAKEKIKSIREMGTLVFKKNILKNDRVYDRFFTLVFHSIEEERNGHQIQTDVLRKCIKILLDLGIKSTSVYKKEFESQFLLKTQEYYRVEAQRNIQANSTGEFLKLVHRRIKEEEDRCMNYLITNTQQPLVDSVLKVMVEDHARTLILMEGSGLKSLIEGQRLPQIKLMYELFSKAPGALKQMESFMVE